MICRQLSREQFLRRTSQIGDKVTTLSFASLDDDALNEALAGRARQAGYPWPAEHSLHRMSEDIGLLWSTNERGINRPVALVGKQQQAMQRLFGRYSQLRTDLSPISSWCHIFDSEQFERVQTGHLTADLNAYEAAWIGLIVAEAVTLSERPLATLKLAGCLATQGFALARVRALWPREALDRVLARYDLSQTLLRPNDRPAKKLRADLEPIWKALFALASPRGLYESKIGSRRLVNALESIQDARRSKHDELENLFRTFSDVPEAAFLHRLSGASAEDRLQTFDSVIRTLSNVPAPEVDRRNELQFLAGYLATIAAGGAPSLQLAEKLSKQWPQIIGWAYLIGSLGEQVTWTSGFDGLGRLIARELVRPLHLADAPTCDFALDEAAVVVDRSLKDPLVHLRIKQARVMSVALYPGVNLSISIGDPAPAPDYRRSYTPRQISAATSSAFETVESLWPHIEARVIELLRANDLGRRPGKSRNVKRQDTLPLSGTQDD